MPKIKLKVSEKKTKKIDLDVNHPNIVSIVRHKLYVLSNKQLMTLAKSKNTRLKKLVARACVSRQNRANIIEYLAKDNKTVQAYIASSSNFYSKGVIEQLLKSQHISIVKYVLKMIDYCELNNLISESKLSELTNHKNKDIAMLAKYIYNKVLE